MSTEPRGQEREAMTRLESGTEVVVTMDDGSKWRTRTRSKPWQLGHGAWIVALEGQHKDYDCGGPLAESDSLEGVARLEEIAEELERRAEKPGPNHPSRRDAYREAAQLVRDSTPTRGEGR